MKAVAPRVEHLHGNFSSVRVYGRRDLPVEVHVRIPIQRAAEREQPSLAVHRNAARDRQSNAAFRALGEVCRELPVVVEAVLEPRVHRAHDDSVLQGQGSYGDGREQRGIGGHGLFREGRAVRI